MSSLVLAVALALAASLPLADSRELLLASDVSTLAPESFRALLVIRGSAGPPQSFEVWRAGDGRTLVRFLDPKDHGKYFVKRDRALFFLSPRARKPVRLPRSYRLSGGAALDQMLGTRYSQEYRLASAEETGDGLVTFELKGVDGAPYPRVSYVVRRQTRRPVRVEFKLASGKTSGSVEFLEWAGEERPHPRRLRVKDALNPKVSADIEIVEVSERVVPEALFSLEDASARRALEQQR